MKQEAKTILLKVMGSPQIGMGHIYRCLSLSMELEREFKVLFHINSNAQVKALLQERGASFFVDEDIKRLVANEGVDLLLFDQLGDDDGLFQRLRAKFPYLKIVALDYFNYDNEFVDVIINLFNHNLQKPKPDRESIQYYEGLEYAIIREEFHRYISKGREIPPQVKRVLITFGGVDPRGHTKRVLQLLELAGVPDTELNVILGPLWNGELPQALAPNIHLHHSISNMADYMAEADLAFCGAGTTMMELLSIGTPTVVLPQNNLEERFALSVEQRGALKSIRGDAQHEDISHICNLVTSPLEREGLSRRGKSLVDGKGKERINEVIHQLLLEG